MNKNKFCYVHIPFCDQKCSYCRFASLGTVQDLKIAYYVDFLCNEITSPLGPLLKGNENLKSIYFGGGTPSSLSVGQLEKILFSLNEKLIFSKNIEITIESTPQNITKDSVLGWKKIGINRISIGVQTLNNESLKEIKRGNKGDIIDALNSINEVGFENVSLDFIIGLPHVKKGEIKQDIQYLLDRYNFIKHISVYLLEEYYEPDMIIESRYDLITYPKDWKNMGLSENEYGNEYTEVKNFLESQGFHRYEISNYAQTGFECNHNKAYWDHSEVVAFGLGAYSYINGERKRNSDVFGEYYKGEGIVVEKNSSEDIYLEKLMFSLRTTGIDSGLAQELDQEKILNYIEQGYLKQENNILKLEDKGVLVMDYILKDLL